GKSLAGLRENERFLRQNDRRLVSGVVGAHASFTLEDSTLTDLSELAAEYDVGVHIHVAEDMCDQADSLRRSNKRVVERLAQSGILTDRAIAAHAVHLDGTEIGLLQSSGSWIAHNCRSNMNNSVGRSPVSLLGDRVILGTDGLDGDMFTETRTAFLRSREDKLDTMAGDFISMLSAGASCATDIFGQPIGGMQPGSAADLVILDYDSPTPLTADNIAWHWIFGFSPAMVESVMVGGRWIMRNREFRGLDEEKVRAESRNQAKRLWDRMQEL
ncbi:MAG TPA: amidohydrolase family protein, partial [Chloroflexota bacterium]